MIRCVKKSLSGTVSSCNHMHVLITGNTQGNCTERNWLTEQLEPVSPSDPQGCSPAASPVVPAFISQAFMWIVGPKRWLLITCAPPWRRIISTIRAERQKVTAVTLSSRVSTIAEMCLSCYPFSPEVLFLVFAKPYKSTTTTLLHQHYSAFLH